MVAIIPRGLDGVQMSLIGAGLPWILGSALATSFAAGTKLAGVQATTFVPARYERYEQLLGRIPAYTKRTDGS